MEMEKNQHSRLDERFCIINFASLVVLGIEVRDWMGYLLIHSAHF
jgi:hypothetical protein